MEGEREGGEGEWEGGRKRKNGKKKLGCDGVLAAR